MEVSMGLVAADSQTLRAAEGFCALGLWLDANGGLEQIHPAVRHIPEVLAVRLRIYRALGKWELMQILARKLALYDPDDEQATADWAFATRRAECIEAALQILSAAVTRLPGSSFLQYELSRCECQLGELADSAAEHGEQVVALE
jgi:hypothetical protein